MGSLVSDLNERFKRYRCPSCNCTLDEFTCPCRCRHRARCFTKAKPEPYHLKGFSLNECESGYCLGFYMYQGSDELRPPNMPASVFPSYKLLAETPELHNCGSTLYADNWFTGIKTMETVFSCGMDYIDTVRTDRTAGAFDDTKKHFKCAKRGYYRCRKSSNVATVPVWCT